VHLSSRRKQMAEWQVTHGHARRQSLSPEYRAYQDAKGRCTNPHHQQWKYYGARGVRFLFKSFAHFLNHIGTKPTPKSHYVLDRENSRGHYEPSNVRWLHKSKSRHNQRNTKLTAEIVKDIRRQRSAGASLKQLADKYGLHKTYVGQVTNNKFWKINRRGD
jgi:YesN/AraC family two-component response regulator